MKAGDKVRQKGVSDTKVYRICYMDDNSKMTGKWERCVIYAVDGTTKFFVREYNDFIEKFERV
ncbi:MAG: hypothetical protein IKY94_11685 [Lachnospiraceae bacterium]|nr:hypothetical protein [Lachnospiraceae bacterium]